MRKITASPQAQGNVNHHFPDHLVYFLPCISACRLPLGGPNNAPITVPFTRAQFDSLTADLWRRCRLPIDQACWQAGVDLGKTMMERDAKKQSLQSTGVPAWRLPDVSGRRGVVNVRGQCGQCAGLNLVQDCAWTTLIWRET